MPVAHKDSFHWALGHTPNETYPTAKTAIIESWDCEYDENVRGGIWTD